MKELTDEQYKEYMQIHYIQNNENRFDIMKDLEVTEYQFYKRNKELGISRTFTIPSDKLKTKKEYSFDLIKQKWVKKVK